MKRQALSIYLSTMLLAHLPAAVAAQDLYGAVSTKGNLAVWRISHETGAVSLCSSVHVEDKPICHPWSGSEQSGSFSIIASDGILSVWRINNHSGTVSLCEYKEVSSPPVCSPWSND